MPRIAGSLRCVVVLVGVAWAAPPPPVIEVTTHLVQVNVVVHNKKGEPVADLTKDDFALFDQGERQKISTFAVESGQSPAPGPAGAPPLAPNTFTNRLELRPKAPSAATVILLDGLNTRFQDQARAKIRLIKFLQQLQPDDRVALYTLGSTLRILHDFTSDNTVLLRALARHYGRNSVEVADSEPEAPNSGSTELDDWLTQTNQILADMQVANRAETTLSAIEAIANHAARLPGRKNLVWISGGFPFSLGLTDFYVGSGRETRVFLEETERTARAVNQANLAIYPVDARGVVNDPLVSPLRAPSSSLGVGPRNPALAGRPASPAGASTTMTAVQNSQDSMKVLASRTGGQAYYNTNDLKSAIRQAMDDSRVTYLLGYYPTHNAWNGTFRSLKVEVERKDVEVRHRLGYFAFAETPQAPADRHAAMQDAVRAPLEATGIGMTVQLSPGLPAPGKLRVAVTFDLHDVSLLEQKDGRWAGSLDALYVQQPTPDSTAKVVHDALNLQLLGETYSRALQEGMRVEKVLDLPSAAYTLKVVLRDAATGNTGSVLVRTDKLVPKPTP
ncbi:MAG: VWA domain-containing protein [Bryobacteraceae bacterium]